MVDGVEGRQQVEADQDSDLLVVGRREDSVQNLQYCSLRVIFFSVCRLELAEVGRSEQVGPQACQYESLGDLGHSRQVGDRPVVRWL